jgi:hypothetical protein
MPDELDPVQRLLHVNGVNARTGELLLAPVPIEVFATSLVPPARPEGGIAPDGGGATPDDDRDAVEREDPRHESEAAGLSGQDLMCGLCLFLFILLLELSDSL